LGQVSGSAHDARRGRIDVPQLIIDPDDVTIAPGEIVLKHTDSGGYFCLGFGPSAEFLRKVDEDPGFGAVLDEAEASLNKRRSPLAHTEDPFLRRLRSAISMTKDFDPEQPRDEQGRWTSVGDGGAASSIADSLIAPEKFVPALQQFAARALAGAAAVATEFGTAAAEAAGIGAGAAAAGAALTLGLVVIPFNNGVISAGTVRDAPDLGYSFDQDTGALTLTRTNADGSKDELFSGHYGSDSLFRDQDGNVIGRHLGGSVVIDPDAVPGYESRAKSKERSDAGVPARTDAIADTDEPKLCPAPTEESTAGRSDRAIVYQAQISGLPPGLEVKLNGVRFDGCRESDGTMLEAKGPGFIQHMDGTANWKSYYTGVGATLKQMDEQFRVAGTRLVEWHVAEEPFANFLRAYAAGKGYANIIVIHTPAVQP
jgi:hypothetical protein